MEGPAAKENPVGSTASKIRRDESGLETTSSQLNVNKASGRPFKTFLRVFWHELIELITSEKVLVLRESNL